MYVHIYFLLHFIDWAVTSAQLVMDVFYDDLSGLPVIAACLELVRCNTWAAVRQESLYKMSGTRHKMAPALITPGLLQASFHGV